MTTTLSVYNQITQITAKLIKSGLSANQNFPSMSSGEIAYTDMKDIALALKNIPYGEVYYALDKEKNYNIKMIDGALIQMLYRFDGDILIEHRLAFFPNPSLESFQNEPELYESDEIYADIIGKNIVTFPIRVDYSPEQHIDIQHPKAHITLGQIKNCRIPVSEPVTPELFISFLLRNFYNTAFLKYENIFTVSSRFDKCITENEKGIIHLSIE